METKHILNEHFDNIYVLYISLSELERIIYKLSGTKLKTQFFMGVNGRKHLMEKFTKYFEDHKEKKSRSYVKTIGAFGHIHSMINILNDAINKNYKKILILEPDIYFSNDFDNQIKKYLNIDYKLLYLGSSQHNWKKIDADSDILQKGKLYYAQDTYGTFAIGIDQSIFTEYLQLLEKLTNPSDVCLLPIQQKYKNQCIVTYPNLIICDVTKSTTVNRRRIQLQLMDQFRWNNNYVIYDRFTYNLKPNTIYRVVIELNSCEKNRTCGKYGNKDAYFKITDENNNITPTIAIPNESIMEKRMRTYENEKILCDDYIIYIYPKSIRTYLHLSNMYADNIYFSEYFENVQKNINTIYPHFIQKMSRYINSKDSNIAKYYSDILNDLYCVKTQSN